MKIGISLLISALLGLAGCGDRFHLPDVCKGHPAHPEAIVGADYEYANSLVVDETNLPKIPPEMKEDEMNLKH